MQAGAPGQGAVDSPGAAEAAGGESERVRLYDFRRPNRISKERMRALEAMYSLVAKSVESWLSGRVRGQVELELLSVEQNTFGEFVASLTTPCSSFVYEVRESGGQLAVIDFGQDFAFYLIDRLLGGTGESTTYPRSLTPLERMVVRLVADRVAKHLQEVWEDHVPLGLTLSRFESIPDMLQIANREDPVLTATIEVRTGGPKSLLTLCVPFPVLEKYFTGSASQRLQIGRGTEGERAADRKRIEQALRATELEVVARLPTFEIPVRRVMELRPGTVLETGLPSDCPIEVLVGGRVQFEAQPGRTGSSLALRITGIVLPETNGKSEHANLNPNL
ncbi:MAG TPA: FliM/FliN family flagellar motor switch protein [Longimicrobiales bacterium]|nr:FliM/FliN family flagellar motor switch protein [Longimicrobiales bacterium]